MDQTEVVPLTPHAVIAEQVKTLRRARGMSAEKLAEEMAAQGVPWSRIVVAKLENKRRPFVTVEELLALAYVLDVAPIHLMVPTEDDDRFYAVTPEDATPAAEAREWIRGRAHIVGRDPRLYWSAVPANEWQAPQPTAEQMRIEGERAQRGGSSDRPDQAD